MYFYKTTANRPLTTVHKHTHHWCAKVLDVRALHTTGMCGCVYNLVFTLSSRPDDDDAADKSILHRSITQHNCFVECSIIQLTAT